jgi:hypothetical protein
LVSIRCLWNVTTIRSNTDKVIMSTFSSAIVTPQMQFLSVSRGICSPAYFSADHSKPPCGLLMLWALLPCMRDFHSLGLLISNNYIYHFGHTQRIAKKRRHYYVSATIFNKECKCSSGTSTPLLRKYVPIGCNAKSTTRSTQINNHNDNFKILNSNNLR